jgi:hypothetical protein
MIADEHVRSEYAASDLSRWRWAHLMRLEDLALIGNCQISALVERTGTVVWCCLPRFDSEPVFSTLLDHDDGGHFAVRAAHEVTGTQRYLDNTNLLETTFQSASGTFRVLDFAPRFLLYGRVVRPTQLFRVIEPIAGTPRIRVRCEPRLGWSKAIPAKLQGSNHIAFDGFVSPLRLTTDIPLAYVGGQAFSLTERRHLALTWGAPIEEPLPPLCDRFLGENVFGGRRHYSPASDRLAEETAHVLGGQRGVEGAPTWVTAEPDHWTIQTTSLGGHSCASRQRLPRRKC